MIKIAEAVTPAYCLMAGILVGLFSPLSNIPVLSFALVGVAIGTLGIVRTIWTP